MMNLGKSRVLKTRKFKIFLSYSIIRTEKFKEKKYRIKIHKKTD